MSRHFPLGKLPPEVLAQLIAGLPVTDPRILLGPRLGEDAAVLDLGGDQLLIAKRRQSAAIDEERGRLGHFQGGQVLALVHGDAVELEKLAGEGGRAVSGEGGGGLPGRRRRSAR